MDLVSRITDFVTTHGYLTPAQRVVLGFSGGPDSVVAFHWLRQFLTDPCAQLTLVYLDHQLRPQDTPTEKALLHELEKTYNIPVISRKIPVNAYAKRHGCSVETAGRALRREQLAHWVKVKKAEVLVTAHHLNDACESFIMQLFRGAKAGLIGIRPVIEIEGGIQLVRPLLAVTKSEILQAAGDAGWTYCLDASNQDEAYFRNRIRHQVLPALEKIDPEYAHKFWKAMTYAQQVESGLDDLIAPLLSLVTLGPEISVPRVPLQTQPDLLLHHFLLRFLQRYVSPDQPDKHIVEVQVITLAKLVRRGFGQCSMPGGGRVVVEKMRIILYDNTSEKPS